MTDIPKGSGSPTRAFSYPGYRYFWIATALTSFVAQIMAVSVGWQIYDLTGQPVLLGLVGLSLFMPALLLVLVTGLTADRLNRRAIMASCLGVEFVCACLLLFLTRSAEHAVWPIFVVLVMLGTGRAFLGPASGSLAPNLVPPEALGNAVTLNATAWQFAGIFGPVAGGLLYGFGAPVAFGTAAALALIALTCVLMIPKPKARESHQATSLDTLFAGVRYIWHEKVVLGAISLDLFAVLLGGAYALMPIYAKDILHAGPGDLGLLRAAPGVGGIAMAIVLSRFPVRNHAGRILFLFVGGFGLFVSIFGPVDLDLGRGAGAGAGRRLRHGQRLGPRDHHAAVDARCGARPGKCRQQRVHRRLQRARRIPRRHGRRLARRRGRRWSAAASAPLPWR